MKNDLKSMCFSLFLLSILTSSAPTVAMRVDQEESPCKRVPSLQVLAERKIPRQQIPTLNYRIATMYWWKRGAQEHEYRKKAVEFCQLAAAQGHRSAQFYLANLYKDKWGYGDLVVHDDVKAASLYRRAADQGHAEAQYNLAIMYTLGLGVEKDDVEASRLYNLAGAQGHANAQFNLAVRHENGSGVEKNDERAETLYRLAAGQDHAGARHNLSIMMNRRRLSPVTLQK